MWIQGFQVDLHPGAAAPPPECIEGFPGTPPHPRVCVCVLVLVCVCVRVCVCVCVCVEAPVWCSHVLRCVRKLLILKPPWRRQFSASIFTDTHFQASVEALEEALEWRLHVHRCARKLLILLSLWKAYFQTFVEALEEAPAWRLHFFKPPWRRSRRRPCGASTAPLCSQVRLKIVHFVGSVEALVGAPVWRLHRASIFTDVLENRPFSSPRGGACVCVCVCVWRRPCGASMFSDAYANCSFCLASLHIHRHPSSRFRGGA